ncbi:MAG: glycoside hydrolase family 127 protein [Mobilitalea sp.]
MRSSDPERREINLTNLTAFELKDVLLMDAYYVNATLKEIEYLLSFDIDKLLAGFRETAGVDTKGNERYQGWETSLIGGHTLGHYLTACVQAYQSKNSTPIQKERLHKIIEYIINGLKECQEVSGIGFLFGSTIIDMNNVELQFDNVENNQTNIFTQAWVPWYTMHKTLSGIIAVVQLRGSELEAVAQEALKVAVRLGDWVCQRVGRWSEATRTTVLSIEYGGMNDCLYDLYQLTSEEKFAEAAHAFDQTTLFERVLIGKSGDHCLKDLHANTTIPKFLGALNRYISFVDELGSEVDLYLEYAKAFWGNVLHNHTYITGGNSEWEHFGHDEILDAERTNCNCETCNVFNMLKLTKKLYKITGEIKYADYYERTFLNSIMSSQNPSTGMTTYFQPMDTGYFKVFGEEFNKFWCCTGTGMENFTKLGESFYYKKDNILVVNQYISSTVTWEEQKFTFIQNSQIPVGESVFVTIETQEEADIIIAFRLPYWLASKAKIYLNEEAYDYETQEGYAIVEGPFRDRTEIKLILPMEIQAELLPDGEGVLGFRFGPVVLSALLGTSDMISATTGIDVTIPKTKLIENEYIKTGDETIIVEAESLTYFIENMNEYFVRDTKNMELVFHMAKTDANLTFVPHYSQYKERYGIYWKIVTYKEQLAAHEEIEQRNKKIEWIRLDTVQPGYGQYENDELHNLQEYGTGSTGDTSVGTSRYANANGGFSYRMIVSLEKETKLIAIVKKEDNGKTLKVRAGSVVVYDQVLYSTDVAEEYELLIELPKEVLLEQSEILPLNGEELNVMTFFFEGAVGEASSRLYNFLYSVTT